LTIDNAQLTINIYTQLMVKDAAVIKKTKKDCFIWIMKNCFSTK